MSKDQNTLDQDYAKIREEEDIEWWRPTQRDNFNLTKKLMRTGCRALNRKYIRCQREGEESFVECNVNP